MEENKNSSLNPSMTRRKFVKASAVTTAATGAVLANPWGTAMKTLSDDTVEAATKESETQIFSGICRANCAGGCFLNIEVRDGKVVRTSARDLPNPEYTRICVKGLSHVQRIYHQDRLKYPMKRAGERGEGKWERISWDEAITTITDKWKKYRKEYGNNAFGFYTSSGSYAAVSGVGLGSAMSRFINVTEATNISATVDLARGTGTKPFIGQGPYVTSNEPADFKNAKTLIIWGANPVGAQQQNSHFIMEAKEAGAKLIVIDPMFTGIAAKADMFVPVRPGSDAALALGMMNIVVRENWIDEPFLKKSGAPFLVKESDGLYLRQSDLGIAVAEGATDEIIVWNSETGTYGPASTVKNPALNGTYTINDIKVTTAYDLLLARIAEYPPEKASEICNVPVETMEELTRIYANNKPSSIYQFFGIDHYVNGHYGYAAIATLAVLTGNLGKPGAFCGMGELLGTNFINIVGATYPTGAPGPTITALKIPEILETNMYGNTPFTLKGVYFSHVNALGNQAERQVTLEMMKKLDFIAVADMNMNETSQYADILLPVAHWFEVDDIFSSYCTHPYVLLQEKAIEPLYECKSDFEIIKMLADKMGYGDLFSMDEFDYMKLWLDTDGARELGITFDRLLEEKAIRTLPGETYVYGDAETGAFPTSTGRVNVYNEAPVPNFLYDQEFDISKERLAYFEPPHEAWYENPLHEKYPFSIIQDKGRYRTHSQWWDVPVLKELNPEPLVRINPDDAAKRNIKKGDVVKVFNDRGYVHIKAAVDKGMQPGVLGMQKGWEKHEFLEGHYQDLTSRVINPYCANSAFFDVLVEVEKV